MGRTIHFIKVEAECCKSAISEVYCGVSTDNSLVEYFDIIGAYNLENPADFYADKPEEFKQELGSNPDKFIDNTVNLLNDDIRPIEHIKDDLQRLIKRLEHTNLDKWLWRINELIEELNGSYYVTDLMEQSKYDCQWHLTGLTNLYGAVDSFTHIVVVEFKH